MTILAILAKKSSGMPPGKLPLATTKLGNGCIPDSEARHRCHSLSVSCGPGRMNRKGWPVLISLTKVLSGLAADWKGQAGNALFVEQCTQQISRQAVHRIERPGITAEALDDARDVDASAARITTLPNASKLGHWDNSLDRCRHVDRRIGCDREDIIHRFGQNRGIACAVGSRPL